MLPWCRGSCHSTHYFAEKVPHGIQTDEFSAEVLEEWINEEIAEIRETQSEEGGDDPEYRQEHLKELIDTLDGGLDGDGEHYFRRLLCGVYDDPPNWSIWTERFLVLREAISWFVKHCDDEPIPEPK